MPLSLHVNDNGMIIFPIWASIEEVMVVHILAVLGATSKPLLYQGIVLGHRPIKIANILDYTSD